MEFFSSLLDLILHLDRHLAELIVAYGPWIYALLFAIVFCETGLVVTPFLPGDSLLFVLGTFAGAGTLDGSGLFFLLTAAAVAGDNVNYLFGRYLGPRVLKHEQTRFFNRRHLERTQHFYARHGGKTLVMARFIPIVRTFAPFVAGIGRMRYARFLSFSVFGGVLWVGSLLSAGYLLGGQPWVRENLSLVIFAIIGLSLTPVLFEWIKARSHGRRKCRA